MQVLRTRSTSLDSKAGSRTSGRGLRRSKTTINIDHSHTLGGMPHAKVDLSPEFKALKLQARNHPFKLCMLPYVLGMRSHKQITLLQKILGAEIQFR